MVHTLQDAHQVAVQTQDAFQVLVVVVCQEEQPQQGVVQVLAQALQSIASHPQSIVQLHQTWMSTSAFES